MLRRAFLKLLGLAPAVAALPALAAKAAEPEPVVTFEKPPPETEWFRPNTELPQFIGYNHVVDDRTAQWSLPAGAANNLTFTMRPGPMLQVGDPVAVLPDGSVAVASSAAGTIGFVWKTSASTRRAYVVTA